MGLLTTIKRFFSEPVPTKPFTRFNEIGTYQSIFTYVGSDIYADETVRACIRLLADHSSKANVKCVRRVNGEILPGDKALEKLIQRRPNTYMNGKDFLYKIRTRLEIDNVAFIYIERGPTGKATQLLPLPRASYEALEYQGGLYIRFTFTGGRTKVLPWDDLAILRKDFNNGDIFPDSNTPITTTLQHKTTAEEGVTNAIQSTANLRGILKSTKSMLDAASIKAQKDAFVRDYLNLENEGGVAALDATQEFTPIKMEPYTANYKHIEEFRLNVYRYFGVNDDLLMSKHTEAQFESFYESRLEPFLLALGLELTNKIYSKGESGRGHEIVFEANRLAYASTQTKMSMVNLIDRGILTINEYREILNMSPVEGGDVRVIRKEYAEALKLNEIQGVSDVASTTGTTIPTNVDATNTEPGETI